MAANNSSTTTTTMTTTTSGGANAGAGGTSKKGKMKGKTVDLTEFLNKPINWAEEMEEASLTPADPEGAGYGADYTTTIEVRTEIIQKRQQLPTAPKAALSTTVDPNRVPLTAPFSAYIGNVSYDASEDDIERFFKGLRVINTRLIREGGRLKGYGYVEFETRDDLLEALGMDKQRFLNREIKIDLADRPEERSRQQGGAGSYGSGRGGRQQRMGSGYDSDKGRDREQETSGDWRMGARATVGPPAPYEDDRRSQPRTGGPPPRPVQQPHGPGGYGYSQPPQAYAAPAYAPPQSYGRRPPVEDYPPQPYPSGRASGYESDYTGGRGGGYGGGGGGGYDGYPMMRQASYSSQYSGYASDRESSGGNYRRGQQGGGAGFYNSMRREYRGGGRPQGPPVGGDRYHEGEGYTAPPYQEYSQAYYQEGYSGGRDGYNNRQQRPRGGYDNRRGGPPSQRDQYGYDQPGYGSGGGGGGGGGGAGPRRIEERMSSVDTVDGTDGTTTRKERPRLALQPRTVPVSAPPTGTVQSDASNAGGQDVQQQQEQPASVIRPRTSVSAAEVFGGARPVDTSAKEREIEEKLQKEREEFRRLEEERKQQHQHQREHVRKSSSSNFVPERTGTGGRRRTSDSQSSTGGSSHVKSVVDDSIRQDEEDRSGGQVKILQRSRTVPSEMTGDVEPDEGENEQEHRRQPPHQQSQQNPSFRPAPPPSQNFWTAQNRRRGGPRNENQEDNSAALSEPPSSKTVELSSEEVMEDGERENETPGNIVERDRGTQSKSSDIEQENRQPHDAVEDDSVFKPQPPQPRLQPHHGGGQRGGHRGGRGGRGGGGYHQHQYQQDAAALPPRFARERDQHQFPRRGSSQTDDGQEQYSDRRRPSKEIVIRRGGQGTLSPATGGGGRRGGTTGQPRHPQHRPGSREREYHQRGNGRRPPQPSQQQRRGSADSGLPAPPQQEEPQAAQKPPSGARRQHQQPPSAPGSRKSSATPAIPTADPPPVSFESKNKFEMLNVEED